MEITMNRTRESWLFMWQPKDTAKTYFIGEKHLNVQCAPSDAELARNFFCALYAGIKVHTHAKYNRETRILTVEV
jgi:hypothetical protein